MFSSFLNLLSMSELQAHQGQNEDSRRPVSTDVLLDCQQLRKGVEKDIDAAQIFRARHPSALIRRKCEYGREYEYAGQGYPLHLRVQCDT